MPPDPPRMSCYAAELPSATMIYSSQFILVATLTLGPLHFWIASYGPGLAVGWIRKHTCSIMQYRKCYGIHDNAYH